jgi:hypothetical protein
MESIILTVAMPGLELLTDTDPATLEICTVWELPAAIDRELGVTVAENAEQDRAAVM